jgi:putative transposase
MRDQRRKMIESGSVRISIARQAHLLNLSRSSLYYKPAMRADDSRIMNYIDKVYTDYPFYGSRRITNELCDAYNIRINRKRVQRIMRFMGLEAIYPKNKQNTSAANNGNKKYPYLLANVASNCPNHIWGTDITYIRLENGFAYLTALLDWFSRYVIKWELSDALESDFCIRALEGALSQGTPLIHNSDQGAQYTSAAYTEILEKKGIQISMDGRGRCMDNIFTERLWRSVKYENVYIKSYRTLADARKGLNEYFTFYNHKRRHQSLAKQTPASIYFNLNLKGRNRK